MPISRSEHIEIQRMIDEATLEQRRAMKANAEATLLQINTLMGSKILSKSEEKAIDIAIEIMVRIEATEHGKGWWFRFKRRIQLTQMYLGV